jgi:hypothetical protein
VFSISYVLSTLLMSSSDRHRGGGSPADPCHTTVRTGPYTAVRDGYVNTSANNDGSPSDLKYALESPTERALAFARYQGPRPLPAVLLASRGRTPSSNSTALRRRGVFHCRHMAALSRFGQFVSPDPAVALKPESSTFPDPSPLTISSPPASARLPLALLSETLGIRY